MKKRLVFCIIVGATLPLFVVGCWHHSSTELCCNSEDLGEYGEASRSYCNDYSVAVSRFLRKPDDVSEREQRKARLKQFLNGLRSCSTIDCIVMAVDTSSLVSAFNSFFDEEHLYAQQRPITEESEKVYLLFCGFEHGLNVKLD